MAFEDFVHSNPAEQFDDYTSLNGKPIGGEWNIGVPGQSGDPIDLGGVPGQVNDGSQSGTIITTPADPQRGPIVINQGSDEIGATNSAAKIAEGAIPNAENAVIDANKVTRYALDPTHPVGRNKATVFDSAFGYNKSNAGKLMVKIQEGFPRIRPCLVKLISSDNGLR